MEKECLVDAGVVCCGGGWKGDVGVSEWTKTRDGKEDTRSLR